MLCFLLITFAFKDFFDSLFEFAKKKMLSKIKPKDNLFFFFHLTLLILYKSKLVKYIFFYEHIEVIYKFLQEEIEGESIAIIYSKILIELITYFKSIKKYNEWRDKEKVLNQMLSICDDKINNNLEKLNEKDLNIDNIKKLCIYEVYYMTVINELKKRNLKDFDDLHGIQPIIINIIYVDDTMLNKLQKLLSKNDEYFKKNYQIKDKSDLSSDENINLIYFNYFLFQISQKQFYIDKNLSIKAKEYNYLPHNIRNIDAIEKLNVLFGINPTEDRTMDSTKETSFFYSVNEDNYNKFFNILQGSIFTIEIVKNYNKDIFKYNYSKIRYKTKNKDDEKICSREFDELVDLIVKNEIKSTPKTCIDFLNDLKGKFKIRLKEYNHFKITIYLEIEFKNYQLNSKYKFLSDALPTSKIFSKQNADNFGHLINEILNFLINEDSNSEELGLTQDNYNENEISDSMKEYLEYN